MTDIIAVTMSKSVDNLGKKRTSVAFRERGGGNYTVIKCSFLAKICDNQEMIIRIKNVMDLKNVRMRRKNLKDFRFFIKTLTINIVVKKEAFINGFNGER